MVSDIDVPVLMSGVWSPGFGAFGGGVPGVGHAPRPRQGLMRQDWRMTTRALRLTRRGKRGFA
jgi:hypothetical protein